MGISDDGHPGRRRPWWWLDISDWRADRVAQLLGRHGLLRPPAGETPLLWLSAGWGRVNVLTAAALAEGLREANSRARVALSFVEDYPERARFDAARARVAIGYGPMDTRRVARRVWRRLQPAGLVVVGSGAGGPATLREAAKAGVPVALVNVPVLALEGDGRGVSVWPRDAMQADAWARRYPQITTGGVADFASLLVDPHSDGINARFSADRPLWWYEGDVPDTQALIALWRTSALAHMGILLVGRTLSHEVRTLSSWDGDPVETGSVWCVEDARWWRALSVSVHDIHLANTERWLYLQALAGGNAVTVSVDQPLLTTDEVLETPSSVLGRWLAHADARLAWRARADCVRRAFWDERRRAGTTAGRLIAGLAHS